MEKKQLFTYLNTQEDRVLIKLLENAYDVMNFDQRRIAFNQILKVVPLSNIDSEKLLEEIVEFYQDSIAGVYYAPFVMNSKNFNHIPKETEEWFERLGELLEWSRKLSQKGEHSRAVQCFEILYKVIAQMEKGEEIVFAHELGSWMLPIEEKPCLTAYITSLAACSNPQQFAVAVLPLIKRDSYEVFFNKIFDTVKIIANEDQRLYLEAVIARQEIKITEGAK